MIFLAIVSSKNIKLIVIQCCSMIFNLGCASCNLVVSFLLDIRFRNQTPSKFDLHLRVNLIFLSISAAHGYLVGMGTVRSVILRLLLLRLHYFKLLSHLLFFLDFALLFSSYLASSKTLGLLMGLLTLVQVSYIDLSPCLVAAYFCYQISVSFFLLCLMAYKMLKPAIKVIWQQQYSRLSLLHTILKKVSMATMLLSKPAPPLLNGKIIENASINFVQFQIKTRSA